MNHKLNKTTVLGALVLILIASSFANIQAQRRSTARRNRPVYYTLRAGEVIRVRLNTDLDSEHGRVGDTFRTTTVDPIYSSNGVLIIPQGSTIHGVVTAIQRAGRDGKPATMDVAFNSVTLPNGSRRVINGSLTDLSSSGGRSDNEGTVSANRTSNRKLKFIGGGAAGGALIGAIAGGGKGLAIGAGVGALTGLIGGKVKKGHEVKVKSGTEFGVILNRSLALPKYAAAQ
jgi:hypothetical protein